MTQCKAHSRSTGERCKANAIDGGTVCRHHGGSNKRVRALATVRAEAAKWTLGESTDDPGEVLLRLITQSRQRADAYASEIERKIEAAQDLYGEDFTLERILVGDTYAVTGDGDRVKTGEYIRGLVQLEAQERDRLAGFASKAIAAGLAERQVRLAERQGEMLAHVLAAVMGDPRLALTPEQRKVMPVVIRAQLESSVAGHTR